MKLCKCGCNQKIRKKNNVFINHHNVGIKDKNPNWKGGRYKSNGYWVLRIPDYPSSDKNGCIREHVYFYQEYFKCCMLPWGVVHHKDGNKENNLPHHNLEGMTKFKHMSLHKNGKFNKRIDMSNRKCSKCGSKETYLEKGRPVWKGNKNTGFICGKCCSREKARKYRLLKKLS